MQVRQKPGAGMGMYLVLKVTDLRSCAAHTAASAGETVIVVGLSESDACHFFAVLKFCFYS